ncbi:hypothetical protein Mgra_00005572 [Meloidogyne graminicola]|uniref:LRRCT domain-containing protein n=1 Tax=Meloidogyne graminicola TaxID=189291 RepID=A0A8S9ZP39_9BILA|nr:hypothetical protein Mgra_00005572 [Meloidogyne graminicola]
MYLIQFLFILFKNAFFIICLLATFNNAFCPPGCECNDDLLTVFCDFVGINAVPILLNPMLKSLTIKNSNGLKLDTFSIALYQELEYLDISNCQITSIPSKFISQMGHLKFLSLRNNKLKLIDDQMFESKSLLTLDHLDISNNQIERITPLAFKSLSSLLELNISFNNLHFLQENIFFGLKKLKLLDLTRNRISKLEKIKIENNKENNLFNGLEQLEELKIGGNLISELSSLGNESFNNNNNKLIKSFNIFPQNLEVLDISGNAWILIPSLNISSLKKLIMEDMVQLREIQENAFKFLPNLESLSLANSIFLSKIDSKAFGNYLTTKIINLNLSNCQLSNLPLLLLDWKKIKILRLEGNRWNCNCQLISFIPQLLDKIKINNKQFNQILCKEPNEYLNIPIINFNEKKIQNCENVNTLSSFLEDEKEEKFFKKYFISIASGLSLLMFTSIALLIYCLCCTTTINRRESIGLNNYCCCCYNQKTFKNTKQNNQHNNNLLLPKLINQQQQQVQLYSTGSTYTESLIYEKENGKGIKSLHCPFYGCSNCPKVLIPSINYQKRESLKVSNEQNLNSKENSLSSSSSSSSSTGEEYYSICNTQIRSNK